MTPKLPASLRVIERGWLSSNNVLAFEGATATLVDSGYVGHAEETVARVRAALAGRTLSRLINTHSHSDHIGGNRAAQRAFGCRIVIPAGIAEHVAAWDEEALLLTPARQRGDRFIHDDVMHPGEEFVMGGLVWRAHHAPGHDMEALVFHCAERRLLISGDALWQDGFGIVFGEVMGKPGALRATRETLDMLGRLAVDTVIPGHGAAFADVDAALARAYQRLAAFEQDPARMARNAIKACFIFNLLDLGSLPRSRLEAYVASVPFFGDVGARLLGLDTDALARWLYDELWRAKAIAADDGIIVPTMAA
ncbi:MAG: MBL fold metallo-hydrolase [Rhodocyclaceae bacterium]|nr:MBL fold metallo-hydrolase [Rhodocyclaceae bacterium]